MMKISCCSFIGSQSSPSQANAAVCPVSVACEDFASTPLLFQYSYYYPNMSSGIGVKGTIGRCYPFYADLRKCVAKKDIDSPQAMCWQENEDYFECVHGFKEKARILEVMTERKRRENLGESFEIKS